MIRNIDYWAYTEIWPLHLRTLSKMSSQLLATCIVRVTHVGAVFSSSRIQPFRFTDVEHPTRSTDEDVDNILDIAVEQTGVVPREFVPLTKLAECTSFDVVFEMVNASPASEQSRCFCLFFTHLGRQFRSY